MVHVLQRKQNGRKRLTVWFILHMTNGPEGSVRMKPNGALKAAIGDADTPPVVRQGMMGILSLFLLQPSEGWFQVARSHKVGGVYEDGFSRFRGNSTAVYVNLTPHGKGQRVFGSYAGTRWPAKQQSKNLALQVLQADEAIGFLGKPDYALADVVIQVLLESAFSAGQPFQDSLRAFCASPLKRNPCAGKLLTITATCPMES